jgi:hypothetical protein
MILLGINGFKTSGKDTAYRILRDNGGPGVLRAAFADKLKIMAASALGYEGPDVSLIATMDQFKETGYMKLVVDSRESERTVTGRQYLQWFGENARKVFGDSFWVDQVLPTPAYLSDIPSDLRPKAEQLTNQHNLHYRFGDAKLVCITDARYPNEAERIKALGGVMLEIVRPGLVSDGHSSEKPLPRELVDYTIHNSGGFMDFETKLLNVMDDIYYSQVAA